MHICKVKPDGTDGDFVVICLSGNRDTADCDTFSETFGIPEILLSDQGADFKNDFIKIKVIIIVEGHYFIKQIK